MVIKPRKHYSTHELYWRVFFPAEGNIDFNYPEIEALGPERSPGCIEMQRIMLK